MLTGTVADGGCVLTGVLHSSGTLSGTVKRSSAVLAGHVSLNIGHEYYLGSYEATPKTTPQILPTYDKLMSKDITVKSIPFFEVSNPQGGTTFIIGDD